MYEFTILPPWYRTIWAYTGYALLFIAFVFVLIKLNSRRLEAKNRRLQEIIEENTVEIRKQKDELSDKNKEITDSINYAQHIQDAILPTDEEIKKKLPDSFMLFKPKDIVSGDFYWFTSKKKKIFIAACDCTGHGVPGAFVSMIGNNLLHQTIIEQDYNTPGQILTQLNMGMKAIFTRKGSEQKAQDGMDMALCHLSPALSEGDGEPTRKPSPSIKRGSGGVSK
ncbi:MAG: hypothetical protein ABII90_01655, partial [Bacteroidota bacterium]